jgi:phage shock protein PspC (stress-responsive transcriptional regulator)
MRKLHLGSPGSAKMLGVCSGIAETYDMDPTLVRLVTIGLCIGTGIAPVAIMYFVAYFVMPKADGPE